MRIRGATVPHQRPDREIQGDVLHELDHDGRLRPAEVGVSVSAGIVTLTGTVSSHEKITAAANSALSVPGVRDVANKLTVDGEGGGHDDTSIALALRHALGWNTAVPSDSIDSIVCRGVVTLRGSVEHWYQRKAAEETVAALPGVAAVKNEIQLLATAPGVHAVVDQLRES